MPAETPEQQLQRLRRNKGILDAVTCARWQLELERRRQATPDVWSAPNPLVTVRICTYERPRELVERAIASVLRQSYQNFEILVVGDHAGPETAAALAMLDDPRVRYHNLPERPRYPETKRHFWFTAGSAAALKGLELARGEWITHLDDDDELLPRHLETLLETARSRRLELVYGVSEYQLADGSWGLVGKWPMVCGALCNGSALYSRRVAHIAEDPFCWVDDDPGDWSQWKRMLALGVEIGFIESIVYRHYKEYSLRSPEALREIHRPIAAWEVLADLARMGGEHYLSLA